MEANSISDFNLICRTCLCTGVELKSIFECNIVNMIHFCQLFKVQPNGEFPNQICLKCHKIITEYNNFKLLCEKSEETLQQLVKEKLNTHNATKTIEESKSNWLQCNQDYDNDIKPIVINTSTQSSGNKCDYCNKNFSNSQFLKKHLKNCHKNLECPKCEIYVPNLEEHSCTAKNSIKVEKEDEFGDLTTFLEADSGPPLPFSCTKCTQSFNNAHDLELHQTTHNTNGEFICTKCNKKYATRQMLKRHIKTHLLHKPHICKLCGKGFAESHALTKHTRKHTGEPREKKHCCSVCGQGFSEPFYLNVHMRKHTGERPLMCASCGKSFADPRSLKAHNMTHTGEKPYKCHICSKAFSQSVNLTKHIRVHTGEKPYVCSQCGKCFTQSSSLDKHSRIHSGLKPYACNTCPKKFSEKGTLIHHHRTHTGEKPYVCEQCGLAFASSSELKLHKRKHTGIKKNICNICGKDFATPSNLVVHSRSHTGEKPFACEFCAKAFADKSSLRKHIKIHEVKNGVEGNNFNVIENLQDFHLKDDNKVDINYYS